MDKMETTTVLGQLRRIAESELKAEGTKSVFPVDFTFRLVLERLESSLNTLEVLVKGDALRHDHSIGLICRNVLSDAIATGYVIKLSSSKENMLENLYAMYRDDLTRTDSFIDLFHKAGVLTTQEAEQYAAKHSVPDTMYKLIRDSFDENGPKEFPSSTTIIRRLLAWKKNDPWSIELQRSFDIWTYYSKYEHLGWYAYELTRNLDRKKAEARLRSVLRLVALLLSSCLEMLGRKEALEESMMLYRELLTAPTNALATSE